MDSGMRSSGPPQSPESKRAPEDGLRSARWELQGRLRELERLRDRASTAAYRATALSQLEAVADAELGRQLALAASGPTTKHQALARAGKALRALLPAVADAFARTREREVAREAEALARAVDSVGRAQEATNRACTLQDAVAAREAAARAPAPGDSVMNGGRGDGEEDRIASDARVAALEARLRELNERHSATRDKLRAANARLRDSSLKVTSLERDAQSVQRQLRRRLLRVLEAGDQMLQREQLAGHDIDATAAVGGDGTPARPFDVLRKAVAAPSPSRDAASRDGGGDDLLSIADSIEARMRQGARALRRAAARSRESARGRDERVRMYQGLITKLKRGAADAEAQLRAENAAALRVERDRAKRDVEALKAHLGARCREEAQKREAEWTEAVQKLTSQQRERLGSVRGALETTQSSLSERTDEAQALKSALSKLRSRCEQLLADRDRQRAVVREMGDIIAAKDANLRDVERGMMRREEELRAGFKTQIDDLNTRVDVRMKELQGQHDYARQEAERDAAERLKDQAERLAAVARDKEVAWARERKALLQEVARVGTPEGILGTLGECDREQLCPYRCRVLKNKLLQLQDRVAFLTSRQKEGMAPRPTGLDALWESVGGERLLPQESAAASSNPAAAQQESPQGPPQDPLEDPTGSFSRALDQYLRARTSVS